jgi:anti-sigma factor RsiW
MSMHCNDVEPLLQAYLDNELAEGDTQDLTDHVSDCRSCREQVAEEARFHRTLRAHLRPPRASEGLRERIQVELDREEWRERKQSRRGWGWGWMLPATASAAACVALLFFAVSNPMPGQPEEDVANDAVRQHLRRPPMEVQGAAVKGWVQQHVSPAVRVPRFNHRDTNLRGARLSHLQGRDAALIYYDVQMGRRQYEVSAMIFDAADIEFRDGERHTVGDRTLWVAQSYGLSIVAHKDGEGIGYLFISEMNGRDLLDFVVTSDLVSRTGESWRR